MLPSGPKGIWKYGLRSKFNRRVLIGGSGKSDSPRIRIMIASSEGR
jgi:hypothetical protein